MAIPTLSFRLTIAPPPVDLTGAAPHDLPPIPDVTLNFQCFHTCPCACAHGVPAPVPTAPVPGPARRCSLCLRLSLHLCACDPVSLAQESAVALSRRCPRRSRGSTSWASLPAEHAPCPPQNPTGVGERGVGPMPRGGTGVAARAEAVASGATAHRVVEVGEVPWVLLVAASPVAADAQLRRWRHAGMSCGMYAHIPSRGPKHLLAPSQASQGMHMLRV